MKQTGKVLVALQIVNYNALYSWGKKCESPNWILDDIDGIKGATAERRLRELREEYLASYFVPSNFHIPMGYGYRPSRYHENYWEYEKDFIEFLKDYVEEKKQIS